MLTFFFRHCYVVYKHFMQKHVAAKVLLYVSTSLKNGPLGVIERGARKEKWKDSCQLFIHMHCGCTSTE